MIKINNNYIMIRQATKLGYAKISINSLPCVVDLSFPNSKTRRGRVQDDGQISPTLTTTGGLYVLEKIE